MSRHRTSILGAAALALSLSLTGCGGSGPAEPTEPGEPTAAAAPDSAAGAQQYPDVESVDLTPTGGGTYDVAVTISSPYDTAERYADGWRVLDPQGEELGTHELGHDHAGEQPFTRTQYGLEIPDGVDEVTVEGRDLANGFGGGTRTVTVPRD